MANYQILNEQDEVVTTIVAEEDFVKAHYTNYVRLPDPPPPPPVSNESQAQSRQAAYTRESDPIFFLLQRGEATQEEWTDKIAEIKERFPYYYDEHGNLIEAQ